MPPLQLGLPRVALRYRATGCKQRLQLAVTAQQVIVSALPSQVPCCVFLDAYLLRLTKACIPRGCAPCSPTSATSAGRASPALTPTAYGSRRGPRTRSAPEGPEPCRSPATAPLGLQRPYRRVDHRLRARTVELVSGNYSWPVTDHNSGSCTQNRLICAGSGMRAGQF